MKFRKHLLSILVASVMTAQVAVPALAGTQYVIDKQDSATVELDMTVKLSGDRTFVNGPVTYVTDGATSTRADFKTILDMTEVNKKLRQWYDWARQYYPDKKTKLDDMNVTGNYQISINYPSSMTPSTSVINGKDMEGFVDPSIFVESAQRTVTSSSVAGCTSAINLFFKVKDGVKVKDIVDETKTYLPNELVFEADFTDVSGIGTHTTIGRFTGDTTISDYNSRLYVTWSGVQKSTAANPENKDEISASVKISKGGNGGGGSVIGGGDIGGGDDDVFDVDFILEDLDDETQEIIEEFIDAIHIDGDGEITDEQIYEILEDYINDGFDIEFIDEDTGKVLTEEEIAQYLNDIKNNTDTKKKTIKIRIKRSEPASMLDSGEHFLYVVGYPDGMVRPEHNISREEVATIFFRLLSEDVRTTYFSKTNSFLDVDVERWSNKAISTMQAANVITGRPDGTFRPADYITRAEFATIVSKLDDKINLNAKCKFTDISGHWAEKYIAGAAKRGWLAGHTDGTFSPDAYITRAEAMSIINRMLNRSVDGEGLIEGTILWPDNKVSKWYYYDVIEATNSHNFTRGELEKNEKWTEITPARDWLAIEEADSRKSLTREQKFEGWEFTAK